MVPKAYFSKEMDIIPLRFVILHPEAHKLRKVLDSYIPTNWFWFTQPVQECESGDPKDLGYSIGSCKNSEKVNELVKVCKSISVTLLRARGIIFSDEI